MKMTPMGIKRKGYEALVNALGVAGTIRFLQQFDIGHSDYLCTGQKIDSELAKQYRKRVS
jgi:hypothetical protein